MLTKQQRIYLSFGVKLALVILAFWFIIKKVINNKDLENFRQFLINMSGLEIFILTFLLVGLMLLNWGIEVIKWKRLIKPVEQISYWKAVQSVFCGLTLAIFTPNRIGEYGGRIFFLSPKRRVVGVVVMAVGNIGQLVVTNIFGVLAGLWFLFRFIEIDYWIYYCIVIVGASFCGLLLVFYLNIRWIKGLLLSFKWTAKYHKFYNILGRYSQLELIKLFVFAVARYAVFSTQYLIIIKWLIPDLNSFDVLMMVWILFFVQSSLPSLAIFDIGIRSLAATHFFGYITDQQTAVVTSTACIWLVNIILPAILGVYFVFKLKIFGYRNA